MISWIQRTFQHHFKVVFAILLGGTIISFIFIYSPSSGIGNTDRFSATQRFFDLNVGSAPVQERLLNDALVSINLQVGSTLGVDSDQLQQYALRRYAAIYLANQLHIPAPTDEELGEELKALPLFAGTDGKFDATRYTDFRNSLKSTGATVTEADLRRVLNDDWRAAAVQRLLGGPGYVQKGEVATELTFADTTWTLAIATVDYASFNPTIEATDAALNKYFADNSLRYQIPPRVRIRYADFPTADYLPKVTVTDDEVRAYYDANTSKFPAPAPKEGAPALDADAKFAAVKADVESAYKQERAQRLALTAASDLTVAIFNAGIKEGSALDSFLAGQKVTLKTLAPFTQADGPAELGGSSAVAQAAFKLDADRFYSDAVAIPDGGAVLFWQESIPSQMPAFAEVKDKVTADYRENEKRKRFVELGHTLKDQITASLKNGTSFADAAAAAAAANGITLETKTLEPFTFRSPPTDVNTAALTAAQSLDKGQITDLIITADKGYFAFAKDKQLPNITESNPEFEKSRELLASSMSGASSDAYLTEIVAKEVTNQAATQ